jgi:dUTP diphosphatase
VSHGPVATEVQVSLLQLDPGLDPPSYAHSGDAGADLRCVEDFVLEPGQRRLVGTGVAIALPEGFAAFVHPRSGLAARHGITLLNSPGTVDAGYRGEIKVLLVNLDPREPVHLVRGDRVAQLVVQRVEQARFVEVDRLPGSVRGDGGYGSTGGFAPQQPLAQEKAQETH